MVERTFTGQGPVMYSDAMGLQIDLGTKCQHMLSSVSAPACDHILSASCLHTRVTITCDLSQILLFWAPGHNQNM